MQKSCTNNCKNFYKKVGYFFRKKLLQNIEKVFIINVSKDKKLNKKGVCACYH